MVQRLAILSHNPRGKSTTLTTTRPIQDTRHNRLDGFLYIHTIHVSDIKRANCAPEVTSRDPCGDNVTTGVQSALHDFSVPQFGPYVNSESWHWESDIF